MDPRDSQKVVSALARGSTAAEYRSAVSRAYYAVFNVAAEHLRGLGFPIGKGAAAHGEFQKCLSNAGDRAVSGVASDMNMLHTRHNKADYRLDAKDVEDPVDAQSFVAQAEVMIRRLDTAFNGPDRAKLQAAIHQWRRSNGYP